MDQLKENETEISEGNNPTLISSLEEPIASEELLVEKETRKEKKHWSRKKNIIFWSVGGAASLELAIITTLTRLCMLPIMMRWSINITL